MTEEQVVSAVDECLDRCRTSPAILVCIAEFVLRLRDAYNWEPKDADEVGRRVLHLIRRPPVR